VLAMLALARVVTQELVVSQNKNFGRNPSWLYVKLVVTSGSTVQYLTKTLHLNISSPQPHDIEGTKIKDSLFTID
jgi:hypothetical protein